MSADPLTTAKRIYEFIGHEIPAELLEWIEQSQKETGTGGTYSTVRNSTATMTAWRKHISFENVSRTISNYQLQQRKQGNSPTSLWVHWSIFFFKIKFYHSDV